MKVQNYKMNESYRNILKEANTYRGQTKRRNDDWHPGKGYFQDEENDYWGNFVHEPEHFYDDFNAVPKNARQIAVSCEQLVKRMTNIDADSNVRVEYDKDNDTYTLEIEIYPTKQGVRFVETPKLNDYHGAIDKFDATIGRSLQRRLQYLGDVIVSYNPPHSYITIYIDNFIIDKNGFETPDSPRSLGENVRHSNSFCRRNKMNESISAKDCNTLNHEMFEAFKHLDEARKILSKAATDFYGSSADIDAKKHVSTVLYKTMVPQIERMLDNMRMYKDELIDYARDGIALKDPNRYKINM